MAPLSTSFSGLSLGDAAAPPRKAKPTVRKNPSLADWDRYAPEFEKIRRLMRKARSGRPYQRRQTTGAPGPARPLNGNARPFAHFRADGLLIRSEGSGGLFICRDFGDSSRATVFFLSPTGPADRAQRPGGLPMPDDTGAAGPSSNAGPEVVHVLPDLNSPSPSNI